MAGLVSAIHDFNAQDVGARNKCGHDEEGVTPQRLVEIAIEILQGPRCRWRGAEGRAGTGCPAPRWRPGARSGSRRRRERSRASTTDPRRGADRRGFSFGDLDREHVAEAVLHLPGRNVVAGMLRQAGIEHAGDLRMGRETFGEIEGAFRLGAGAKCSVRMPRIRR